MTLKLPTILTQASPVAEQAVEVTSMLGDTVLSVTHLGPPTNKKSSKRTAKFMFGMGALLLLVSTFAFAKGVANAADNKSTYREATEAGLVAEYRPNRISLGYDWLALGGLAGGIAAFGFGLAAYRRRERSSSYTLGRDGDCDFAYDHSNSLELVRVGPTGPVARVAGDMDAQLELEGAQFGIEEMVESGMAYLDHSGGGYQIAIPPKAKLRVLTGINQFLITPVAAPREYSSALFTGVDGRTARFVTASAAAHLALLALIWTMPVTARSLAVDIDGLDGRLDHTTVTSFEDEKSDPGDDSQGKGDTVAESVAMGLKGTMGTPETSNTSGRLKVKNRNDQITMSRTAALNRAKTAGVLGAMASNPNIFGHLSALDDFTGGLDDLNIAGGLDGARYAAVNGPWTNTWGSYRDNGVGSAYYRDGVLKTGDWHTGGNFGPPTGRNGTGTDLKRRNNKKPNLPKPGPVTTSGGLDKTIIRRYIRRSLARIGHCYDRQLISNPNLAGTMHTSFVISGNGAVLGAKASGINSSELHSCVASVLSSIKFPATDDGSTVTVRYPFTFRQTGR